MVWLVRPWLAVKGWSVQDSQILVNRTNSNRNRKGQVSLVHARLMVSLNIFNLQNSYFSATLNCMCTIKATDFGQNISYSIPYAQVNCALTIYVTI